MCKHCFLKTIWNTQIILICICVVTNMDISLLNFWSDKDKNLSVGKNIAF